MTNSKSNQIGAVGTMARFLLSQLLVYFGSTTNLMEIAFEGRKIQRLYSQKKLGECEKQ